MAVSAPSAPAAPAKRFGGLLLRVLSAALLAPPFLAALWVGYPWIDLVAAVAAPIMMSEWWRLGRGRPLLRLAASLYTLAALAALLWLRHQPDMGRETILWLVACVWATDSGAFFLGILAGGAKLAPRISPSKTWSGLVGGMCASAVVSSATGLVVQAGSTVGLALAGVAVAIVAQLGDLLESAAKRQAGVKNSGRLIPGHGGVLDRVDGLIAVLVAVAALRLSIGGAWPWT